MLSSFFPASGNAGGSHSLQHPPQQRNAAAQQQEAAAAQREASLQQQAQRQQGAKTTHLRWALGSALSHPTAYQPPAAPGLKASIYTARPPAAAACVRARSINPPATLLNPLRVTPPPSPRCRAAPWQSHSQ